MIVEILLFKERCNLIGWEDFGNLISTMQFQNKDKTIKPFTKPWLCKILGERAKDKWLFLFQEKYCFLPKLLDFCLVFQIHGLSNLPHYYRHCRCCAFNYFLLVSFSNFHQVFYISIYTDKLLHCHIDLIFLTKPIKKQFPS